MRRETITERPDWRDKARAVGFGFHEMYGEPYWVDNAYYAFSLDEIEGEIEDPSAEVHQLCLDLVDVVVSDDAMLRQLDIPEAHWSLVRDSWSAGDRHLYGRFDFAYDGSGPVKLLEYNADTPTSIFESAFFQHNWLIDQIEAGRLPDAADQFNLIQESLVEAFQHIAGRAIIHFACATDNDEDCGTAAYLMDCAVQAGHDVHLIDISNIGVDAQGRFTDDRDRVIDRCFKLYPWEDMLREPFARHLTSGVFIEPPWKALLSNKAMLPLLWARNEGHPNLLPTYFEGDTAAETLGAHVVKPLFSREGENITINAASGEADADNDNRVIEQSDGDYADERKIVQAYAPLWTDGQHHAVLGSWMIGDRAAGLGMREDASRITRNLSRFVPHVILDA